MLLSFLTEHDSPESHALSFHQVVTHGMPRGLYSVYSEE